ncbi:MAG: hypothetical protein KA995_03860 [Paludibacteraceae bacterium]|jgi:hypothetical protein|nr:hypothetical protein [Paludibacteraceae bacterium]NLK92504.1 plasmid pRiA4b ORF-3 family protein [Bacteroidales bacterium]MBP6436435.1 hypothetical protein [Paludibacteraceae bacterium]MBP7219541.1 hypothetical protein [Paludibacteraceae bacterium]MBP8627693.1 hypothetical protein [Paludibacteraceae bacterium]
MLYKFIFISDEVDNFMREITIDSAATFLDLHKAILESVSYTEEGMASFFICNDYWEKEQEITLIEMDTSSEYDNYVMEQTGLEEFISEEKQKILYVFDYFTDRAFFIELKEIIPTKRQEKALCTKKMGEAPSQFVADIFEEDKVTKPAKVVTPLDENFYGDEDFDMDELDEESFSDVDFSEESDPLK